MISMPGSFLPGILTPLTTLVFPFICFGLFFISIEKE